MSASPVVRPLEQRDLAELELLCREHAAYERAAWPERERADSLGTLLLGAPATRCWVVEAPLAPGASADSGTLAGFASASLELSTWDAGHFLHLDCLFLRAAYRGRGWGRALFERVASAAAELGAVNLQWQTPIWNSDAIRFYQRLGARAQEKLRFTLDRQGCRALLPPC